MDDVVLIDYVHSYVHNSGGEMRERTVSIAQARANLPGLIRDTEEGKTIEITRRGSPVAILLSASTYRQLVGEQIPFREAFASFLLHADLESDGLEGSEFVEARDPSPGRDLPW